MARLKGELASIDLMKPFSIRSGGRVIDLSKNLHFEVQWDGSNVIERFTQDVLNGSGHTDATAPGDNQGFSINGTGNFDSLIPNLSWTNDAFTISFWVNFKDVEFTNNSYTGIDRQYDFISSKDIANGKYNFSSLLRKDDTGFNVRAYFGLLNYNFDPPCDSFEFNENFCDTYDNSNIILGQIDQNSLSIEKYTSQNATRKDINFNSWNLITIRSAPRKNGSFGICDLWVNGEKRSRYISNFIRPNEEKSSESLSPGCGVFEESQLIPGGKYYGFSDAPLFFYGVYDIEYPDYMSSTDCKLYLSNHEFFQIAKWNRILDEEEIKSIYYGTLNGVYNERFTSISIPPRKKIDENFSTHGSFSDSLLINDSENAYYGSNKSVLDFNKEINQEMSGTFSAGVLQQNIKIPQAPIIKGIFDDSSVNFNCIDSTRASSTIKIDISSIARNDNLQIAGRTHSKGALSITAYRTNQFSMLLSSSHYRHGRLGESYRFDLQNQPTTGIAGTGLLYYSPKKKCWVEKRPQHETFFGLYNKPSESNGAVNAIEINPRTFDDSAGGWIKNIESVNFIRTTSPSPNSNTWFSSKMLITGTNEIMRQFTASPQLAYFTSKKEYLKRAGYENIGSPTIAFGAPFSPKYHAFSDETISMHDFIDSPFLLKKVILKIPVEIQRINELNEGQYKELYKPVAYFNFESALESPSTVPDLTNNGHIATLVNEARVSMDDTPGSISTRGCLDLTYNSPSIVDIDTLVINNESDLCMNVDGLSISFCVKFSDFNVGLNHSLIYKVSQNGNDAEYYLFYDRVNNKLSFRINDVASSTYTDRYIGRSVSSISSIISDTDKWYHIVVACDGSNSSSGIKIYVDGIREDDSDDNFSPPYTHSNRISSNDVYVGSRGLGTSTTDLRGKIAFLTFWNRQLQQEDVDMLYVSAINSSRYNWNWTENVTMRKDMDNYVFFLYRQRRSNSGNAIDSLQDISSSVRFLIGSGSVCVYNSSSFGLASKDGFIDAFGINTPITSSYSNITKKSYLNEMFRSASAGKDPITSEDLLEVSSPLHSPAASFNVALNDNSTEESYVKKMYIEIQIDPAYTMGGYPNNTLMYVTTSKGHLSTSFYSFTLPPTWPATYNPALSNRLFNWYPQKGTNSSIDATATPPITTIFQNVWFGGTVQPVVATDAINNYQPPGSITTASITPFFQFDNRSSLLNGNSGLQDITGSQPEFDIEVARTGLSIYNLKEKIFEKQLQLVVDGRSTPSTFSKNANPEIAAVFQRTELNQAVAFNNEAANDITGTFSIADGLKDSSFSDLIASLTVGYAPSSPNEGRNIYSPYVLLPDDELVLGLDAGVTPPPDVVPYHGKNLTDYNPSGGHKSKNEAFINQVLKEKIWHYAGNSYMRILPGDAEIILIGDYTRDNKTKEKNRPISSTLVSTIVGDEFVSDGYDNSETSAYVGTYQSQIITGSMFDNTRGVAYEAAARGETNAGTIGKFVSLSINSISLLDQYISGVIR